MNTILRVMIFAASSLLVEAPVKAQTIGLSPSVVELSGRHGQSVTHALTLRNDSDVGLDFTMEARDVVIRNGARAYAEPGELGDSVAASAVFSSPLVHVPPRKSSVVKVTLTVPPAMRHRAVVIYCKGTNVLRAGRANATLSLGALFTFRLSEQVSVQAAALEAAPPSASANAQFRARLLNDGAEPVVPGGMAMILDAHGRAVGKAPFRGARLLPGEAATLVAEYPGDLAPGTYRAVATLDIGGKPLNLATSMQVP
jgi:hypothetical protein